MPRRSRSPSSDSSDSSDSNDSSDSETKRSKKSAKKKTHKKHKKHKHKEHKKKKKSSRKHHHKEDDVESVSSSVLPVPQPEEGVGIGEKADKIGVPQLLAGDMFGLVEKKTTKLGLGPRPVRGQEVSFHCVARMRQNGQVFWRTQPSKSSSADAAVHVSGEPFKFHCGLATAIRGFDEGLLFLRKGEVAELTVTGNFGYGVEGFPPWKIPPMCDLLFDVTMLDIGSDIRMADKMTLVRRNLEQRTFKGRQLTQIEYLLPGGKFFRKHSALDSKPKGSTCVPGAWSICI